MMMTDASSPSRGHRTLSQTPGVFARRVQAQTEHEETRRELNAAEDKAKRLSEKLAKAQEKLDDTNAKGKGHERAAAERRAEVEQLKKERDEYKAQRTLAEATLDEERHAWQVRSLASQESPQSVCA